MGWLWTLLLAGCAVERLDTGGTPVPPWLQDDDGDAFTPDEDCADADAAVHPGAPEVCDGRDQDCDFEIDEDAVDAVTRYPDEDGDGAYDPYATPSCDPPPGAAERRARAPRARPVTRRTATTPTPWRTPARTSVAVETRYLDRTAAVLAGAAYLVLGPASGTREAATADAIFLGESTYDLAGSAVAGAGDTDGDGALELLVGAEDHDGGGANGGAAYLLRGPFSGTSSLAASTASGGAEGVGAAAGDLAGSAVAGAGDFDGDGFDDWMVGAWPSDRGGESAGTVFLLYGSGPWSADLGAADLVLRGTPGAQAGLALSGGSGAWGQGDLTGDGLDDLLIGAPVDDALGPATGAGYLVAGQGL